MGDMTDDAERMEDFLLALAENVKNPSLVQVDQVEDNWRCRECYSPIGFEHKYWCIDFECSVCGELEECTCNEIGNSSKG